MQDVLSHRLDDAVAQGLLGIGCAHRVSLAAWLAATLPGDEGKAAEALSGEALGRALGLSRAAVHKHVEQLRELGVAVEPVAGAGYRLARPFTDLVAAETVLPFVLRLIDAGASWNAGLPYHYLSTCGSTSEVLKRQAASSPAGTVVVTDEQTGGRGRLDRTWVSGPGKDLTFSVLLRPTVAPARAHLLSLAGALAVAEVLESIAGLKDVVGIKWPNDVLLGGEKVCGILLEGSMDPDRIEWAVAGIGLNVNSDPGALLAGLAERASEDSEWQHKPRPTSLRAALGRDYVRAPLLAQLLARLTERWRGIEDGTILEGLRARDVLVGRRVTVLSGPPRDEPVMTGEAIGIGAEGQLLVRDSSGETVAVFAGDVTVRAAGDDQGPA
ncbi:MAG: biotin--[acetyl-CoA-carboxylase] ligase [Thermoleophilia bacterium]|nr:biotin--[acetyl-CoA-carboxylase] ligase [Thermoleophilia bacterium]